ncbi:MULTISPECIES: cytochrome b/b6 domain-containing protein [Achromobacter]|uniref:Cytochrome b/b6 domain-containing protein n=1 Tax=Achromobacter spanius TaxID=217203 RepID=A0ABY8GM91_9BURK|nr:MULTISPECIES: cytochrome b/b6 domain-containing protein [Achromobacter]WAI84842.1 cytochrome b/b6 domain-containing protein [Achromobacter spanius]WEX94925.1 cytochrome b/b6 domain-containing protein [Achromobacter sp. SS2-2022]WFP05907.1 cytochrome b/b6 domain-containing protein [Achromobacter spanius]
MNITNSTSIRVADSPTRRHRIRRHSVTVRITHWINVLCFSIMLLSGLQIFNAHPRLYWGQYGADTEHALLEIGSQQRDDGTHGFLRIGALRIETTGILGVSNVDGADTARAFPAWLTIPSYYDLGAARNWHFLFAWLLVINGLLYLVHGLWRNHIRGELLPDRDQLTPRHLWREIVDHARLRFAKGDEARRYNALQKLTYLMVALVLLPLMVLTGLTMSPGIDAAFPFLPDWFGGRQSARTLHFITASSLVLFVIVHVLMVVLSGFWNNIRSMITGRYDIDHSGHES